LWRILIFDIKKCLKIFIKKIDKIIEKKYKFIKESQFYEKLKNTKRPESPKNEPSVVKSEEVSEKSEET